MRDTEEHDGTTTNIFSSTKSQSNSILLLLWLDKIVNDRVKEDSSNANAASQQLHEIKRLAKD